MDLAASKSKLYALQQCEANMQAHIQELQARQANKEVEVEREDNVNKAHFDEKVYPKIADKAIISEEAQTMFSKVDPNILVNADNEPKVKTPQEFLVKKAAKAYAANK